MEEKIFNLIHSLKRKLFKVFINNNDEGQLPHNEFIILRCICENKELYPDGMKPSEIGTILKMQRPIITPLLNKLEAKQYINRDLNTADRRFRIITITAKGKLILEQKVNDNRRIMKKALSCLDEHDIEELINILIKMNKHLENELQNVTSQKEEK